MPLQVLYYAPIIYHMTMNNLWKITETYYGKPFPDFKRTNPSGRLDRQKRTRLTAQVYTHDHFIKAREVDIWDDTTSVYNNILYLKLGVTFPVLVWILWDLTKIR